MYNREYSVQQTIHTRGNFACDSTYTFACPLLSLSGDRGGNHTAGDPRKNNERASGSLSYVDMLISLVHHLTSSVLLSASPPTLRGRPPGRTIYKMNSFCTETITTSETITENNDDNNNKNEGTCVYLPWCHYVHEVLHDSWTTEHHGYDSWQQSLIPTPTTNGLGERFCFGFFIFILDKLHYFRSRWLFWVRMPNTRDTILFSRN